ncbi:MAG TPA: HdeD family acid-resistance protein [Trebonia sp.]|nr:HdeD family acid-resistance protein [Trebonia sp.]
METESPGVTRRADRPAMPRLGWGAAFALGLVTLILGAVIISRPTHTLIAVAVLLGIAAIVSGIYHIARVLDAREGERVWRGISGVLFLLAGLALLRHLDLTIALIGLFIGFTWIIQGVMALLESFSGGRRRAETGWSVFFGVISLIAGIVVVSAPIASVSTLTVFMGAWFIVMGVFEMLGALVARRADRGRSTGGMRVPEQRSGTGTGDTGTGTDQRAEGDRPAGGVAGPGTAAQGTAGGPRPTGRNVPR